MTPIADAAGCNQWANAFALSAIEMRPDLCHSDAHAAGVARWEDHWGEDPSSEAVRWCALQAFSTRRTRYRELEHLRQADRHIATGSRNVAKQFAVVQALEVKGLDVGLALNLLEVMREMLSEFQRHRRLIVDAIKDSRQDG